MKNYIVWIVLAVLMMTGAFAEGLIEGLPRQLVQANGVLIILSAMTFVGWSLKVQASSFRKED